MTADLDTAPVQGTNHKTSSGPWKTRGWQFTLMLLLLVAVISFLLHDSFLPDRILFSNRRPPGSLDVRMPSPAGLVHRHLGRSQCCRLPGAGALPNITCGLRLLLQPFWFSKFYVPIALLILGLCAWVFFRQLGLAPPACILGSLATVLNSCFFSTACWGVAGHVLALAMTFLALAALVNTSSWRGGLRIVLAGMAIGMALAEGADMGAIFSLCVAVFVFYQARIAPGSLAENLVAGAGRIGIVAIFAAFLATYSISALLETQVHGVTGMQQDVETRENALGLGHSMEPAKVRGTQAWPCPVFLASGWILPMAGLTGAALDATPNGLDFLPMASRGQNRTVLSVKPEAASMAGSQFS